MTVCTNAVPMHGSVAPCRVRRCAARWPGLVAVALLAADVAPAAAVGDVAELGDVDVDQRAGMVVLVAAQRFAGDPVDVREPVDPAADQHGVHGRGRHPEPAGDLDRARAGGATAAARSAAPLLAGSWSGCGAAVELRSAIPAGPSARYRSAHFFAVRGRDHEHLGRRGVGPAVVDDEPGQPQTGASGSGRVSVGHEGLRLVKR